MCPLGFRCTTGSSVAEKTRTSPPGNPRLLSVVLLIPKPLKFTWIMAPTYGEKLYPAPPPAFHPSLRFLPVFPTGCVKPPPTSKENRDVSCALKPPKQSKPKLVIKARFFIQTSYV